MEYRELLHRCFRCGWCKFPADFSQVNCPSYTKYSFETYSPGGRLWLIRAWLDGELEATDRFRQILYSCATCKSCTMTCGIPGIKDHIVDMVTEARQEMVATGKLPAPVRDYFMEIYSKGNPFRKPQAERGNWAEGMDIPLYSGQEYLFYVGDAGSFDETSAAMTCSAAELLRRTGISFGILGEDEISDGNDVRSMGEKDLFAHLAEKNIAIFRERGVKKVVTLSPHAYNAFVQYYPEQGADFECFHYTQIIAGRIKDLDLQERSLKVTYHDPCYLGRWNGHYELPRRILQAVPGLTLAEMGRNRESAFCCGGGGGNYYTDMLGSGEMSPSRVRIREAAETGAEVIAVTCPVCYKMLDDALKDEGLENSIRVRDVSSIVLDALK